MVERLTNEEDKLNWFSVTYVKDSVDCLELNKSGEDGIEELKKICDDDSMIFFVFSLKWSRNYVKELESFAKTFYGMIQWNGKNISVLEKGLNSHHFKDFQNFVKKKMDKSNYNLSGSHLFADTIDDINYERLIKVMCLYD